MAGDDEEALRLNTLHRFRKHSPRMLLHEYSHCEVPAGCGGVVLRWLDPIQQLPIRIEAMTGGEGRVRSWIDGEELQTRRADLRPGRHVLALEVRGEGPTSFPLAVVLRTMQDEVILFSSQADGSWLATSTTPPAAWTQLDFAASDWRPLELHPDPRIGLSANQRWKWDRLPDGVQTLRMSGPQTWIRFVFTLEPEQIRGLLLESDP